MTRIVTTVHRYKRPAKKRKAVALEGPANDLDPAYVGSPHDLYKIVR